MRAFVAIVVLAALLVSLPGGPRVRAEGEAQISIKIATLVPRTPELTVQEKRANEQLAAATGGRLSLKTYYGGTAGDDVTVMRKMKSGSIDASPLGVDVVGQVVHQCTILMAPQTFFNYRQVDAVRKELSPAFEKEAWDAGYKIVGWFDAGRVRIFSKEPVQTFEDLRKARPWLYPPSALLKEFYKMTNVTGVPLDLNEVYAALSTNMIDVVWMSSVLGTAFRWTSVTKYVSSTPVDVIQGAFLLRRPTWEGLSPADQKALQTTLSDQAATTQKQFRTDDDKTYAKLLNHGLKAVPFKNNAEWEDAGKKLRLRMVGRTYSKELLDKVEAITKLYPGND